MDLVELEQVVRNVDARVARIEQILPTLATKEDLKVFATKEDLKAYATKDDLSRAIEPLATREEMRAAIREEGERTRSSFNAVAERLETKIQLIAEGQAGLQERFEGLRTDFKDDRSQLDRRVTRLEAWRASRPPRTKPQ